MQSLKRWIKKYFGGWIYSRQQSVARKSTMEDWVSKISSQSLSNLAEASFDNFTYHGEDGILLYLLSQIKNVPKNFVDIGAGDCIKSNCANLAVHYGWEGLFIEQNDKQLAIGQRFYKRKVLDGVALKFLPVTVTRENVNSLINNAGVSGEVGLLSVDIDGNDYWIWEAITIIQPRIVLVEAKVEFGNNSVAVPYSHTNHYSVDKMYNGASVEAFRRLGRAKGYKLVGANKQGYNLFFVKENEALPTATSEQVLNNPETIDSFYPASFFSTHIFESI